MENATLDLPRHLPESLNGEVLLLVFDGDELHDPVLASARLEISETTWRAHFDRELLFRFDEDYVRDRIDIAALDHAHASVS